MGRIIQHITSKKERALSGVALSKAKETKKAQMQVEYETLISTIKGEKQLYNAISKKTDELCKTKEDLTVSIGMLANEKGIYKKAMDMQKKKIAEKAKEISAMDKTLAELDMEMHRMQEKVTDLQRTTNELTKYASNIDVVRDEKASLKQHIGRLKGTQSKIKGSIKDLDKDFIIAKKKQDKDIEKYIVDTKKKADKANENSKNLILVESQLIDSVKQLKEAEKDLLTKADDEVLALKAEGTNLTKEKDLLEGDIFKSRKELLQVQKDVATQRDLLDKDQKAYELKKINTLDEIAQLKLKHKLDRIKKAGMTIE